MIIQGTIAHSPVLPLFRAAPPADQRSRRAHLNRHNWTKFDIFVQNVEKNILNFFLETWCTSQVVGQHPGSFSREHLQGCL